MMATTRQRTVGGPLLMCKITIAATYGADGGTRPVFDSRLFLPNGLSSIRTVPQVLEPQ